MTIVRYFHIRHIDADKSVASKGGATVRVEGELGIGLMDNVLVTFSYCSPLDQFCRKTGREEADLHRIPEEAIIFEIPLKGLPGFLRKIARMVLRKTKGCGPRKDTILGKRDWSFSTKYWLPKPEKTTAIIPAARLITTNPPAEFLTEWPTPEASML